MSTQFHTTVQNGDSQEHYVLTVCYKDPLDGKRVSDATLKEDGNAGEPDIEQYKISIYENPGDRKEIEGLEEAEMVFKIVDVGLSSKAKK